MAAYCRRFGLGEGWLVYAGEVGDDLFTVLLSGPTVFRLAVELDGAGDAIRVHFARFSARVVEGGCSGRRQRTPAGTPSLTK